MFSGIVGRDIKATSCLKMRLSCCCFTYVKACISRFLFKADYEYEWGGVGAVWVAVAKRLAAQPFSFETFASSRNSTRDFRNFETGCE
jgi:hypothetical protein